MTATSIFALFQLVDVARCNVFDCGSVFAPTAPYDVALTLLILALFPPVEELLFRRVLLGVLLIRLLHLPAPRAIAFSSVFFAFAHFLSLQGQDLSLTRIAIALVELTFVGALLGALYVSSEQLVWPVVFHLGYLGVTLMPKADLFYRPALTNNALMNVFCLAAIFCLIALATAHIFIKLLSRTKNCIVRPNLKS